jgi:hypothetical protein
MEHVRTLISCFVGVIVITGSITIFAISPYHDNPAFEAESCDDLAQCTTMPQPVNHPDVDKTPTLAPPRTDGQSTADNALHTPSFGQTVYVQVKTDHADIEVGWAPSEFRGR